MSVDTVIVDVARRPIGRAFKGSLVDVRPDDMTATVISALLERNPGFPVAEVADVVCGVVAGSGEQGYNLGRVVGQLAGLPITTPGTSVNRFCASSLQALRMAHHAIQAGEGSAFVVAGVESVSRRPQTFSLEDQNPRLADRGRSDFVTDMYMSMVETAERVADLYAVSRHDMDEFAAMSHARAIQAREDGAAAREIVTIDTPTGAMTTDDGPRPGTTVESLSGLRPVVGDGGRVTAGNACPLNDGAAAALVMSGQRAEELGLRPRARVLGTHVTGLDPTRDGPWADRVLAGPPHAAGALHP